MTFDPRLADIRFGCGLSPTISSPSGPEAVLAQIDTPDSIAARYPVETFDVFLARMRERIRLSRIRRDQRGTDEGERARKGIRELNQVARKDHFQWLAAHVMRRVETRAPFRERLETFWADHFTATGKRGVIRRAASSYWESAIRPNVAGRFEDLLIAAVTHPLMVHYLDQQQSIGPNSVAAKKGRRNTGLNENLAREILELHTLGVGGPYTQKDVTEFAELLTGLTLNPNQGRQFRKNLAEPGAEIVLGKRYGGENAHIRDIEAALRDLARHPATAAHLARKLAVHFVSDRPDPALVRALEAAWLETGGDLRRIYAALLAHPAAWQRTGGNVKQPFDFIASSCRALAVPAEALLGQEERVIVQRLFGPMRQMGHVWQKPDGPDGLDEDDDAWITPQGMAARLQWAMAMPRLLLKDLPDPRALSTPRWARTRRSLSALLPGRRKAGPTGSGSF